MPEKAREPFKTALAIVISYGIALAMDWGNPYWAAFAVAFVSLSTAGQSFNKAAMRMFGTLVGIVAALSLIALFPQQRWLFILAVSVYVGVCTYLMTGPKKQYFWNVSGFVCVLLCMSAGPDPVNAFDTAVLRAQETGLGILVYSLVTSLLWPVSSRKDFFAVAGQLASGQRQFCQTGLKPGQDSDPGQAQALKGQLLQAQTKFQKLLDAAESDTQEVWEMRRYWRLYQEQTSKLTSVIGSSVQSLAELEASKTPHLATRLDSFLAELDNRFAGIGSMISGQAPGRQPEEIDMALDAAGLRALSQFQRAAVVVFHDRLKQLDQLTRTLFETTRNANGFGEAEAVPARTALPTLQWPDPDRMLAVIRVMLTLWLAFLAWIYVDSIPGGTSMVTMACVYGMIMASIPMVTLRTVFKPLMAGVVFGSLMYMLVLPHLSGFLSLGTLLFVTTFSLCYFLSDPKQALAKTFALAMFVSIASIDNQQVYSFMVVATNVLMFPVLFSMLAVTAYFPVNLRQEKSFLRLLNRY
ncbi:MAG: FUSC family protein, partial [Xanthomonadales bacterium]|nr:FUSC family protein [Xanthomonadales bacterium]